MNKIYLAGAFLAVLTILLSAQVYSIRKRRALQTTGPHHLEHECCSCH